MSGRGMHASAYTGPNIYNIHPNYINVAYEASIRAEYEANQRQRAEAEKKRNEENSSKKKRTLADYFSGEKYEYDNAVSTKKKSAWEISASKYCAELGVVQNENRALLRDVLHLELDIKDQNNEISKQKKLLKKAREQQMAKRPFKKNTQEDQKVGRRSSTAEYNDYMHQMRMARKNRCH